MQLPGDKLRINEEKLSTPKKHTQSSNWIIQLNATGYSGL